MRVIALLAACGALLLTGCTQSSRRTSTNKFKGAEKDVAQKVADLAEDGRRKRASDICDDVVATKLRDQIAAAGSSCAAEMKKAIDDADNFSLDVTDVSITGDAATARVKSASAGKDVLRTFRFAREPGGWRISAFG